MQELFYVFDKYFSKALARRVGLIKRHHLGVRESLLIARSLVVEMNIGSVVIVLEIDLQPLLPEALADLALVVNILYELGGLCIVSQSSEAKEQADNAKCEKGHGNCVHGILLLFQVEAVR